MPSCSVARAEQARRRRAITTYREHENKLRREHGPRAIQLSRPFAGVDGEGGNIGGRHEYLLLSVGRSSLETGSPLRPSETLGFLADRNTEPIYVGFFFDYDVTMIVRDLPPERVSRLVHRELRQSTQGYFCFPVDVELPDGSYQIEYLPHKEFKVRRVIDRAAKQYGRWVRINDVGAFFQCSFVQALTDWRIGTDKEREQIAEGKQARSDFGELTEETKRYNLLEIDLLEQLMSEFRETCRDVEYVPARWQGPGAIAECMLRRNDVPKTRALKLPPAVIQLANEAYYGGRFETTSVGPVYGGAWQYDICSAYPDALGGLPCLQHARWSHRGTRDLLHLARVDYRPNESARLYGLPFRSDKGNISYPGCGSGVYWSVELDAAIHQQVGYQDWWTIETTCDCDPFHWVEHVYRQRLALGKTAKGKVLKLALNSLYGKTVQSIGSAPYANPVWGSLITSLVRAKLGNAAHGSPACCDDVHMLATDALFTSQPRELPIGKALGEWEQERHEELFIVQPGLYFTGDHAKPKTRGIPRQAAVENRQLFWDRYADLCLSGDVYRATVTLPVRSFTGIRIADARGKLETAGRWVDGTKDVGFEWSTKRDPQRTDFDRSVSVTHPSLRTWPVAGVPGSVSMPYSKDIGRAMALSRLEYADNPDWADVLFGDEL